MATGHCFCNSRCNVCCRLLQANASEVPDSDKPMVAYVSHFVYGDSESYQISWADYKVQLVNDSGAQILPMAEVAAIPGKLVGVRLVEWWCL